MRLAIYIEESRLYGLIYLSYTMSSQSYYEESSIARDRTPPHLRLPLQSAFTDTPSPQSASRFSRFFRNLTGQNSLPATPSVNVDTYFQESQRPYVHKAVEPMDVIAVKEPEQRGMLGIYERYKASKSGSDHRSEDDTTIHDNASVYSIQKENPYLKDHYSDNYVKPLNLDNGENKPDVPLSLFCRLSQCIFNATTMGWLLILLKCQIIASIVLYGLSDAKSFSSLHCSGLNSYAATTSFGPNLLFSTVSGQMAQQLKDKCNELYPSGDIQKKTGARLGELFESLEEDYFSSVESYLAIAVKAASNTSKAVSSDVRSQLKTQTDLLQENVTLLDDAMRDFSEAVAKNPVFDLKKDTGSTILTLDKIKKLEFVSGIDIGYNVLHVPLLKKNPAWTNAIRAAKHAVLESLNDFYPAMTKVSASADDVEKTKERISQAIPSSYESLTLCADQDKIDDHYGAIVRQVESRKRATLVVMALLAFVTIGGYVFWEVYSARREEREGLNARLKVLQLSSHKMPQSRSWLFKWCTNRYMRALALVTVGVSISCICDLSLLNAVKTRHGDLASNNIDSGSGDLVFITNTRKSAASATLDDVNEDIARFVERTNEFLGGELLRLRGDATTLQKNFIKKCDQTMTDLAETLYGIISRQLGSENWTAPSSSPIYHQVEIATNSVVAPIIGATLKIDRNTMISALTEANVKSLPGFAPVPSPDSASSSSLQNLIDMISAAVTSQQYFAIGTLGVWVVYMAAGTARHYLVKRQTKRAFRNIRQYARGFRS